MSIDASPFTRHAANIGGTGRFVWPAQLQRDPRLYQILVLGSLIIYGVTQLGFPVSWAAIAVIFSTSCGVQYIASKLVGLPRIDLLSAIITGCSLTLLARSAELWGLALVAALAIGSKFVLRAQGRHIFNPANFALVAPIICMLLATKLLAALGLSSDDLPLDQMRRFFWISPGQWGSDTLLAFAFAGGAMLVLFPAARWDVALAFLGGFAGISFALALYRGDPMGIPLHQLQSGALLLFSFFMITDPATTPASRTHRIIWGLAVATLGAWIIHDLQIPAGPIIALTLLCPLVPWLNRRHRATMDKSAKDAAADPVQQPAHPPA